MTSFSTIKERIAWGESKRKVIKRVDQGIWSSPSHRADPVEFLKKANRNREQSLLPIKWDRMAASPFGFFRGAAPIMAADLAGHPVTGLRVQMCGDAHIRNLGAFAAPDGRLVFDLNDFDETLPGPWEWDVKRLATSLFLAGEEAVSPKKECWAAVRLFAKSYREAMWKFAKMKVLELFKYEVKRIYKSGPLEKILRKAERSTPIATLQKLTVRKGKGGVRFHDRPPLLSHVPEQVAAAVLAGLRSYRNTLGAHRLLALDAYHPVDVAFKVVGLGSVGTRDYVVLLLGRGPDDPLFLQVKEELPSCYAPYLPVSQENLHQGQRVAEGQLRMQTQTDPFLGWTTLHGADYLVRQLADHKAAIEVGELKGEGLLEYGGVCGEILAKAHARTGDPAAIAGYAGESDKLDIAMVSFAVAYAKQTEKDHATFLKAIRKGRIKTKG